MATYTGNQLYYNTPSNHGHYQFTSLDDIIKQFMAVYVGEDKIIPKARRVDVAFHAQRAMQELSFDTFKSFKSIEFLMPNSLHVTMPQDYVNYTKISWIDSSGIKHRILPTNLTSNPSGSMYDPNSNPYQNSDGDYKLTAVGTLNSLLSNIPLDGEYLDIKVGMFVKGPYIPANTYVRHTQNSGGITTVVLGDAAGGAVFPTQSADQIGLSFERTGNELVHDADSTHVVESLSWNTTDYKITASGTSDFDNIEVGMFVSHVHFSQGTRVTNVDKVNGILVVSNLPTVPATAGEITFISFDATSDTWNNYKSLNPVSDDDDYLHWNNARYGLDPVLANVNGAFYVDEHAGKIHFSSNLSGKTIVLDYLGDGLSRDSLIEELKVHKFAEEAMYKYIIYAMVSTRANIQEYIVRRFKKEKFAAIRTAKLRLSNIKLEEIIQDLRGKSKQIKH